MVPPSDTPEWLNAVASVQAAKMTPAAVAQIRERAQSVQRTASLAARSRTLERTSSLSLASFACSPALRGYRSVSAVSTPASASMRQQAALTTIESMDSERAEEALDSLEASLDAQRASLAAEGLVAGVPGSMTAATAVADDIEGVLRELREEPADEAECTAKFGIFEGYLSTVEKVRGDTYKFWEDAKAEFGQGARVTVEAGLKKLDSHESMGLSDDAFGDASGVWFVQPMARQASRNNAALTATLASLRTKLELLNRDCDCPICLEPIDSQSPSPAMALPCCHRVCQPCWQGWMQARGVHNVFCPLCRHADFLEFVLPFGSPAAAAVAPGEQLASAGMEID